ncbi:hypothetical protein MMC28_004192 [Mycoblastus sanguinarius]|nr:hypothetical protein [Mycoblastus sanguinarius]
MARNASETAEMAGSSNTFRVAFESRGAPESLIVEVVIQPQTGLAELGGSLLKSMKHAYDETTSAAASSEHARRGLSSLETAISSPEKIRMSIQIEQA